MLDGKDLRALIRDVIATELAAAKGAPREASPPASAPAEHRVRIASDADVAAFARQVLALAENPATRHAIAAGSYRFKLDAGHGAAPIASAPAASGGATRIDSGVVTEGSLAKLPKGTRRLEIGPAVSVTPLARDRARNLGITIERMKP